MRLVNSYIYTTGNDDPQPLFIERRDFEQDVWAIRKGPLVLLRSGKWDYEPQPSSRTDAWLAKARWTESEAIEQVEGMFV